MHSSLEQSNQAKKADSARQVVACLGASITEAKGSFDWIGELSHRRENQRYQFLNFGRDGDTAHSALQRLDPVVASRPTHVIIALGWNDIVLSYFPHARRFMGGWKRLPAEPGCDAFAENLSAIVRRLKADTSAQLALCSLSPMGENPNSTLPVQRDLNRLFQEYSAAIKSIAQEEGSAYIPFFERVRTCMVAEPGRDFAAFRFRDFYWNAFRQYVLRWSLEEVSRVNGWRFHVDGLHLNRRGGLILAHLVQAYLDGTSPERPKNGENSRERSRSTLRPFAP